MSVGAGLQLKPGQDSASLGAPETVGIDVPADARPAAVPERADAATVVVANSGEFGDRGAPAVDAARADRLSWVAYPKAGQLGTDLNRDVIARLVEPAGVRPVRQVAIDDVWSAPRFPSAAPD